MKTFSQFIIEQEIKPKHVFKDNMVLILFKSHRARDYGLRAIDRKPQGYYSMQRSTFHGAYLVTPEEYEIIKKDRFGKNSSLISPPFDDMYRTG